jgi:hypothetical protein
MVMGNVSTTRKLGIVARVAGRQMRQTRTFGAALRAGRATATHFGRVLGQLWLEVTGFVFLALAGIGVLAFFREYAKYRSAHEGPSRMLVAICFAILFGWFGLSSFWRIRRKG